MKTLASLFVLPLLICSHLQGQYNVQIIRPAGVSLSTRDLWNCIVTNAANTSRQVFLHGTITEARAGKVFEINSAVFDLTPGAITFNTAFYQPLTPEDVLFTAPFFEDYVVRTNTIPRGSYTFCIDLISSGQQQILATSCIDIQVLASTPPALIAPMQADSICELNPFFIWTPPQPPLSGPDVSYELFVYEVQGQQNPVSSTLTNALWYRADNLSTPIAQYGIDGRPFVPNRAYAWYVRALEGKTEVCRSEVWSFVYKDCNQQGNDPVAQDSTTTPRKRLSGVHYFPMPEFGGSTQEITNRRNDLYISYLSNDKTEIHVAVRDQQGAVLFQEPVAMLPGYNYLVLPAQQWKFNRNQHHTLHLTDALGRVQVLSFWHRPD
jgi:hypothetical protein